VPGKPTVRGAQSPGGNRMTEKRNAGSRKAAGNRDRMAGPFSQSFRITGRIPGLVPGRESVLTRSGESVKRKMTMAPEPKDKLDATASAVANGPEDESLGWDAVDWRACEESVRRLRQRIFAASQAGDLGRVRNLQRLMLRSRANTLLSVRRVTERNAGRLTAGVDGEVVLTREAKMELAERVQREPFKAQPVRRVYIPKKGSSSKRRPLGIPTVIAYPKVAQAGFGFVGCHPSVSSAARRAVGGAVRSSYRHGSYLRVRGRAIGERVAAGECDRSWPGAG